MVIEITFEIAGFFVITGPPVRQLPHRTHSVR